MKNNFVNDRYKYELIEEEDDDCEPIEEDVLLDRIERYRNIQDSVCVFCGWGHAFYELTFYKHAVITYNDGKIEDEYMAHCLNEDSCNPLKGRYYVRVPRQEEKELLSKGDIVKCINNLPEYKDNLTIGNHYCIIYDSYGPYVNITADNGECLKIGCYPDSYSKYFVKQSGLSEIMKKEEE